MNELRKKNHLLYSTALSQPSLSFCGSSFKCSIPPRKIISQCLTRFTSKALHILLLIPIPTPWHTPTPSSATAPSE